MSFKRDYLIFCMNGDFLLQFTNVKNKRRYTSQMKKREIFVCTATAYPDGLSSLDKKRRKYFPKLVLADRIVIQILHTRDIFIFIRPRGEKLRALARSFVLQTRALTGQNGKFGRGTRATFFRLVMCTI